MGASEQVYGENHATEPFDEDPVPSYLPKFRGIYEDPILFPRVGGQYQVDIPPVETKLELFQFRHVLHDDAKMTAIERCGIGLAIPLKWVQYCSDNAKMKCEKKEFSNVGAVSNMEGFSHSHENSSSRAEIKFSICESVPEKQGHASRHIGKIKYFDSSDQDSHVKYSESFVGSDKNNKDFSLSLQQSISEDFYPLPCMPTLSLSNAEKQSFLLGLYIFGKNLIQVKKFMEIISMGEILSFYYGKFYRSDAYHKWSESRKIRSRRSVHGQRIFTGWRQQELLSRVLNSAHKELEDTLLEAAKSFNEGRATLEEFVFKIKTAASLQVLVEAIGIGKGAHDLTCVALEQVRTNPAAPLHSEIPFGRACSFLTSADIINFLTGDFRLSKAKSNDLFWEAVWPRLLAKGWHSEQPRDQGLLGFKNSLVFLIPGVKKFSRKRLVKGTHFFDSVSDVLSRVASDQRLLELDVEGHNGDSCSIKESELEVESNVYRNGSSNPQCCYLHPRHRSCYPERLKFTVVDTSVVEGSLKVIGVRSLPSEVISSYRISANSEESQSESSLETEDSTYASDDEDDSILTSLAHKKPEVNRALQFERCKNSIKPAPKAATINGNRACYTSTIKLRDDKVAPLRCNNIRKVRPDQSKRLPTALKRRKLIACCRVLDRQPCSVRQIQEINQQIISKHDPIKDVDTLLRDESPFQERTNLYQLANSTRENGFVSQTMSEDKLHSLTLFDLNNFPTDATEISSNELEADDLPLQFLFEKQQIDSQVSAQESIDILAGEQASAGIRRQSTRNRPPTARALEALASGLLGTKRSWKSSNSTSRPLPKVRKAFDELLVSPIETNLASISSSTVIMSVAEPVSKD